MPPLSAVNKARLLESGDVEISLVLPHSVKDIQLIIHAIVEQRALPGRPGPARAHTSWVFDPPEDGAAAVFSVPHDPTSEPFDEHVGIEVRANSTWACWSSLDGEPPAPDAWTWKLSDWG
jgi:hypothetical protein